MITLLIYWAPEVLSLNPDPWEEAIAAFSNTLSCWIGT
jgi:hypothetical protein